MDQINATTTENEWINQTAMERDTGACPPGSETYRVQRGDSFYLIARKFGVSVRALMNANPNIAAGHLLDRMLAAIGLRREQVYICNIVKCRPPQNRVPEADERAACMDYLRQQVALVRPKVIVCLGSTPTRALLGEQMRITRDRGVWQLKKGVWFMPTYHPAALLRDADKKRPAWADFQAIRDKLIELNACPKTEAD